MRRFVICSLIAALAVGPVAADSIGPGGTFDGVSFGELKLYNCAASDVYTVPLSYHATVARGNWAGVGFTVAWDPTEVNNVNVTPAPGYVAMGGPTLVTIWGPGAWQSGITNGPASVPFPIGNVTFHVTGTWLTGVDTDIDIWFNSCAGWGGATFSPFNIWHVTAGMATQTITLEPSALVYFPLEGTEWYPVEPGYGTWIHLDETWIVHLTASLFWGTWTNISGQGGIGVDHIPEPASAALMLGGLGLVLAAWRRR